MENLQGVEELTIGERIKNFIMNFRDDQGRLKYMDRIYRMMTFEESSIEVDFADLYKYDPSLAEAALEEPQRFFKEASEALREIVASENPEYVDKKRRLLVRLSGLFETLKIREVKSEYIGKLVQIEGIITRMHPVASRLVRAVFRHDKCGLEFTWPQSEDESIGDKVEKPSICPQCGEGGGRFVLLGDKSEYIDWQKIVVQEKPEDVPGGQMPRSIEVDLTGELVDRARPGDRVVIVGIVKLWGRSSTSPLYNLYIEANNIKVSDRLLEEVVISREDEERIKELARDPWIKEKIIASIAPSIYGHWNLKEAIALLLFGGVPKVLKDGTRMRGDIHVLFIGDPGVAKSQLLQSAARIAPRAVVTSGKGSTAAGLTAAVIKDPRTGEYYLEAGAMVLADGGVAIIDEIDKMDQKDRTAIHEAMEQQFISISKAGIVARLNARASVLAAGNPKLGVYDPTKSFIDNVNLPPTILSRFDLIFVVRDVVGEDKDKRLAMYIIKAHGVSDRFQPEIEPQLLRKYIAYARKYVKPRLTRQAEELILNFFVEMRSSVLKYSSQGDQTPIPITARQLEAIIRLAEAHARMALREEVTEEDAMAAIRITLAFLESVGMDIDTGTIDVSMIMTGTTLHSRKIMSVILDVMKKMMEEGSRRCIKYKDLERQVREQSNVPSDKIRDSVERLHQQGLIIEVREGCYAPVQ